MASDTFDVLVVGSGLGGLTTALLLARLGRRVALVEQRPELGGVARSFRRRGVDLPVGIHYFGAAGKDELLGRVWSALGLHVPLVPAGVGGPLSRYHFGDQIFELPVGFAAFEAALRAAVPGEAATVKALVASLRTAAEPLCMRPRVGGFDSFESAGEYLRQLGCSPRLQRLLAIPEAWLGMTLEDCPRSSYELALASYLLSAYRLGCTGAQLVEHFAARFTALGGELIAGDGARRLSFDGQRATSGVVLASGRRLHAPQVVLGIHPKLVPALLGDAPGFTELGARLRALPESATASMGFALVDAERTPARAFNTYLFDDLERSWFQVTPSERSGQNVLCVVATDRFERWRRWEHTRVGERGDEYLAAKMELGERLLATVRRAAAVERVEWLELFTPLSFRDWVGTFEGSLYGVSRGGLALAGLNRCGVPGLRFVGQSLLAPGVIGVTFGALRVAGDLGGRAALAELLAEAA